MNVATAPPETRPIGQPRGLWVLIFTETWERFSHYGMRSLLILYLTAPLAFGGLGLDKVRAGAIFGGYMLSIYLFGINGGQIADRFLGTKRTIVTGGLFIAAGQLLLQVRTMRGLIFSLVLISIGTCLLKANISASVGRLYAKDDPRRDGAFTLEYMGINIGACVAPLVCGFMAESPDFLVFLHKLHLDTANGWSWAFGVSGLGMLVGLANFIFRRHLVRDVSLPEGAAEPAPVSLPFVAFLIVVLLALAYMVVGAEKWYVQLGLGAGSATLLMTTVQYLVGKGIVRTRAQAPVAAGAVPEPVHLSRQDVTRILVVLMMLCFSATFWFVFQQAGSSLNIFAKEFTNRMFMGHEVPASWFQTINAFGIVALGPLFVWIWTRRDGRWPSSPVKFALGLLLASLGFWILVPGCRIVQHIPGTVTKVGMGWLFSVYTVHTLGELCISPVGLSYVSRLAPRHLTSLLMGAWFFSIGIGGYLAGKAAGFMESVPLARIYGFGATVSMVMGLVLLFVITPVIRRMMGGHS